jgi:cytoskeletal protein RodZ
MVMTIHNRTKHIIDESTLEDDALAGKEAVDINESRSSKPKETPKAKEPKERAGTILRKARESQGLSLEIVHEATKIPMDALRAIEEGYKVRMLSPFYYRGFVKMYAGYLNIDVSQVVEGYKKEELPEHIEQEIEDFQMPQWITDIFTRRRKQQLVIAAGVLVALFFLFKVIGFLKNKAPKPSVKKVAVKKEVVKIEAVKKEITQQPRQEARQEAPKIIAPKEAPKVVAPAVAPKPIAAQPAPSALPPPAVVQKNINLTVRANQNSWLRVKTDGQVVFQSTLRTGAVETWLADNEIEISGRNINQLEFELNGKMIGTLGRKERNAKSVVVTKNGLSVKQ